MKTNFEIFNRAALVSCFLVSATALAGTSDGGGGVGVRCQDGRIELLDLHEAKIKGLRLLAHPSHEQDAIELASEKLGTHFALPHNRDRYTKFVESSYVAPLFAGHSIQNPQTGQTVQVRYLESLPLSQDIGHYQTLPGCQLEQIAYMNDETSTLEIVKSNWAELDNLSRSALIAHEIFYYLDRSTGFDDKTLPDGKKTSERSRTFIGRLFSEEGVRPKFESVPTNQSDYRVCGRSDQNESTFTHFNIVKTGTSETTAVFSRAHGRSSLYEMKAVFSGLLPEDFNSAETAFEQEAALQVEDALSGYSYNVRITKKKWGDLKFQTTVTKDGSDQPLGPELKLFCWEN